MYFEIYYQIRNFELLIYIDLNKQYSEQIGFLKISIGGMKILAIFI